MLSIYEAFPSRSMSTGERPTLDVNYILSGTADETIAREFLAGWTATVQCGLLRQSMQMQQTTPDTWECTVRYGAWKEPEAGDWKWDFDASGTSQKITQSKANIHNYAPAGETAPDFKGAIGVTDDSVEGCEIIVPQFKWTETHQLSNETVTWGYSQTLYDLVGKTNDDHFRGFSDNQMLFHGARGSQSAKNPDLVEMTFSFAASRDATALAVGEITGIAKKAWEYLWVRYGTVEDAAAKRLVKRPTSVHIERVYDEADFSDLGIGT